MVVVSGRRLLIVSYFYPPDRSVGSHRWHGMARHLRELGHEVTVLTTSAFGALADDAPWVVRTADLQGMHALRRLLRRPALTSAAGSPAVTVAAPRLLTDGLVPDAHVVSWLPLVVPHARRLVRDRRVDCVVTNGPPDSTHLLGLLLGRRRPAWIADFEDGWRFEPQRSGWPTSAQDRLDASLERVTTRRVDAVVGLAKPIADDFARRFGVDAEYVPNGWDPALDDEVAAVRAPARTPGTVALVHTGNLSHAERRDPRPLLRALERIAAEDPASRLRLVLAGRLTAEDAALLSALSPPTAALVEHLGELPRAEAVALQRSADALLLIASGRHTSTVTGKIFEYLTAQPPILALAAGNEAARIVTETRRGLVINPADVDAIAAALRRLAAGAPLADGAPKDLERYVLPGPARTFADTVERAIAHRSARGRRGRR